MPVAAVARVPGREAMPAPIARTSRRSQPARKTPAAVPAPISNKQEAPDRGRQVLSVLRQFRELFRVSQQHFQRIEADCGISGAQLWALTELGARPGLKVSEVAHALSIHLSTASNLLDKLEARKLIRRERGTTDQRVVKVFPTAEGKKVMKSAPRPAEGVIPAALSKMPDDVLRRVHHDLELLLKLAGVRNPKAALKPLAEP